MMNSRPAKKPKAPRGPFKELRGYLTAVMGSKAFLVVISLVAALFFWGVLVASDGTLTRQKVFSSVAVTTSGEAALKSRGYIVIEDLSTLIPSVRMTVEVTQSNYTRVSGTSYNPHIDLNKIKGEGQVELPVSFSSTLYGPVVDCQPKSVTVNVERYITRRIPVVLETRGAAKGHYLDSVKTDPAMLSVSGPQSLISSVARAVAKLDISQLSGERPSDRMAVDIELQNVSGEAIESDLIEITNQTVITRSVVVETELIPMREIPLDLEAFVAGEPAEGYECYGVEAASDSLEVAAKAEVLDALTVLTTDQPLDIAGAQEDVTGYVRLRRPSGIENTVPYDVAVTAKIREKTLERTLRRIPVLAEGLGGSLAAELSPAVQNVQLTGPYGFVKALKESDVRLYVDLSGLDAGVHEAPVQISIDNAPEFECALSTPEISVRIERVEP
ncbi:MAG: hypothetical protein IKB82_00315 [Clostridia bacterium]|nr:hypothetical protein [Clostridia bacterium]